MQNCCFYDAFVRWLGAKSKIAKMQFLCLHKIFIEPFKIVVFVWHYANPIINACTNKNFYLLVNLGASIFYFHSGPSFKYKALSNFDEWWARN